VDLFLSSTTGKAFTGATCRVFYKKHELLSFREHLSFPFFDGCVRITHLFSFWLTFDQCIVVNAVLSIEKRPSFKKNPIV
jgi:hypothetical protein